jgi:hypothetical protein
MLPKYANLPGTLDVQVSQHRLVDVAETFLLLGAHSLPRLARVQVWHERCRWQAAVCDY